MSEFTIEPLSPILGAEVVGLDLREPLDEDTKQQLDTAFAAYHVLCFRDQSLTKEQQLAATRQFGELDVHVQSNRSSDIPLIHIVTNMDDAGAPRQAIAAKGSVRWHSDKSYRREPSLATFLYALEVPPEGGETQFANTTAAFQELSPEKRAELDELQIVHSWPASRLRTTGKPASPEEIAAWPPVTHPLARTHPPTGKKALFVGEHASHIDGRDVDGRAPIDELEAWCTQDRFVYAHCWQVDDLLMWDNRCLLHRAAPYDGDRYRRLMHRTVTQGAVPF